MFASRDYTGIAISSQQELPRTKSPPGPPYPKKDPGFADYRCQTAKALSHSTASVSAQQAAEGKCRGTGTWSGPRCNQAGLDAALQGQTKPKQPLKFHSSLHIKKKKKKARPTGECHKGSMSNGPCRKGGDGRRRDAEGRYSREAPLPHNNSLGGQP